MTAQPWPDYPPVVVPTEQIAMPIALLPEVCDCGHPRHNEACEALVTTHHGGNGDPEWDADDQVCRCDVRAIDWAVTA